MVRWDAQARRSGRGLFLLGKQALEVELAEQRAFLAGFRSLGGVTHSGDRLGDFADDRAGLGGAIGLGEGLP